MVRHAKRPFIGFSDEYDVQDALHALLRLHFADVRPEEYKIAVEVKKTRSNLKDKEVYKGLGNRRPYGHRTLALSGGWASGAVVCSS